MEKFKLNIEYKAGNTVYKTNLFETPDFKINYKASTQRIRLDLKTKVPIEILNLTVTVPYVFDVDDRVFPNGYQSWTDCREMFRKRSSSAHGFADNACVPSHPFRRFGFV